MTLSDHFSRHQLLLSSEQHGAHTPGLPEGKVGEGWVTQSTLFEQSKL